MSWDQITEIQIRAALRSFVTLSKLLKLSTPQFLISFNELRTSAWHCINGMLYSLSL